MAKKNKKNFLKSKVIVIDIISDVNNNYTITSKMTCGSESEITYELYRNEWLLECNVLFNMNFFNFIFGKTSCEHLKAKKVYLNYVTEYQKQRKIKTLSDIINEKDRFLSYGDEKINMWFGFDINISEYGRDYWNKKLG